MTRNKNYTPEESNDIIKMLSAGKTVGEIAKKLGRSEKSVYMRIYRMRYAVMPRIHEKPPQTVKEVKPVGPKFSDTAMNILFGVAIGFAACMWMTSMGVI